MRNIKYRAWNKAERVMISADDLYLDSGLESPLWKVLEDLQEYFHIMQFTGILDVNGVEIYEGDIVKRITSNWGNNQTIGREFVVEWGKTELLPFNKFPPEDGWEVVGNVYENPSITIGPVKLADGISRPELDQLKRYAKYLESESKNFLRHSQYAMAQFDKELKEVKEKIEKAEE